MNKPKLRCALYTRKSSEEGLDQAFNSLDAQREACAAYVTSQASEGWKALPTHYDNGGFSGGSMERPALRQLLVDIEAGRIDVVVVYKIDRLTRALADFARMLELFDRHAVSFVSVTQAFNTTTSMGRLTLNVLLSFAQFEREVTGERIRDKIAASKARGLWMGGTVPLGYDVPRPGGERVLVVNPTEAKTVRSIFRRYLDCASVTDLLAELAANGIISKRLSRRDGTFRGGVPFNRSALFYLLRNRTYRGEIVHKGTSHPGRHTAIVDDALFDSVQQRLSDRCRRGRNPTAGNDPQAPGVDGSESWLTGRIVDARGEGMSATSARGRSGKRFRYYVTRSLQKGQLKRRDGDDGGQRISAPALEARVADILTRLEIAGADRRWPDLIQVKVGSDRLILTLRGDEPDRYDPHLANGETLDIDNERRDCLRLIHPAVLQRRRYRTTIVSAGDPPRLDSALIAALRAAHRSLSTDRSDLPRADCAPRKPYARSRMRLAFLAPDIQRAILTGRQPPRLTLARLLETDIPLDWHAQRCLIERLSIS